MANIKGTHQDRQVSRRHNAKLPIHNITTMNHRRKPETGNVNNSLPHPQHEIRKQLILSI